MTSSPASNIATPRADPLAAFQPSFSSDEMKERFPQINLPITADNSPPLSYSKVVVQ